MLRPIKVKIAEIYVPMKFKGTLDAEKVQELAQSIAQDGMRTPIHVREDKDRYVLVGGLHRLEACKELGEETIVVNIVQAKKF
jgi:sulfiredoxin